MRVLDNRSCADMYKIKYGINIQENTSTLTITRHELRFIIHFFTRDLVCNSVVRVYY